MANRLLLILLTIFISASSFATPVEQDLIKSASDAFQKAFPKDNGQEDYNEGENSLGDINNDGVTDFVTLLYTPNKDPNKAPNDIGDTQIAVFLGNKEGSFSLYKLSGSTFRHERIDQRVEIRKGSIFLYRRGGIPCCGEDVFQFKLRTKNIVLIGSEYSEFVDLDQNNGFGKSINFITGDVMYWGQTMKKRKEVKAKFKPPALIKIEDFSYPVGEPKGAEGYIDEKFNFVK